MDNARIAKELVRLSKEITGGRKFQVGDIVKYKGGRKLFKVEKLEQFGLSLRGVNGKGTGYVVDENDIVSADSEEVVLDKKGRSAAEAAQEMAKRFSNLVVIDYYNTQKESVGKILKITKSGRMQVQQYHGSDEWLDQEDYIPNMKQKGERLTFSPKLFRGEWKWWSQKYLVISGGYRRGDKLTRLLD